MKIAISGAQGTGKTTLLEEMQKDSRFKKFLPIKNVTRSIKAAGFNINEEGNDNTQLLIMSQHIQNFVHAETSFPMNSILERCALDGFVYTSYLYKLKKVNINTLKIAEGIFRGLIEQYDIIFYLPCEFCIKDDGVRSTDTEFQEDVELFFTSYIRDYRIPVVTLTGSVEKRIKLVNETYDSYIEKLREEMEFFKTLDKNFKNLSILPKETEYA